MRNRSLYIVAALIFAALTPLGRREAAAQFFGRNKVQYEYLKWEYIQTPHFDIYFNEGGLEIAEFTAREAEKAYSFISDDFRWRMNEEDRLSIITYKSHNEFEQTNVTSGLLEEGVGGFTESFKNRVVVPYEGSWEDYRHVIHHELTHAASFWMLYGSGLMSVVQGVSRTRLPLWFFEGLAEYESRFGMDTESDMYIRDFVVNSRLPNLEQLDYYGFLGAYKCGQSVMHFISQTYGEKKIGELMHRVKNSRDANHAFKNALGFEWKELNRKWHNFINKRHWPTGAVTQQPVDFAEKITDHKEEEINYYDISPAVSPRGDMLCYISNRSDYFDIHLYSLVKKKRIRRLVSGERTKSFEELHVVRPGISWSPDSKNIVFASKAGGRDAVSIVDVETGKIKRTISFDLDGMFSPAWNPVYPEIAFVGIKNGQSDICIVDLKSGEMSQSTDDVFSDLSPSWSPDGERLVFSSDRAGHLNPEWLPEAYDLSDLDYQNHDIYIAHRNHNWRIERVTQTPDDIEKTPVFLGDSSLVYSADANGIFNLYYLNLTTGENRPLTNVVTGCLQPSVSQDGDKLAFVSLFNLGYDVYLLTDPLEHRPERALELTPLKKELLARPKPEVPEEFRGTVMTSIDESGRRPYRHYVFDFSQQEEEPAAVEEIPDTASFKDEEGDYVVNKYKLKMTTDYVFASAYFSSIWGARGVALAHFSDILGNHNFYFMTDLQNRLEISNYLLGYQYLPYRVDFEIDFYHFVYYFSTYSYFRREYFRDRDYGVSASASYPFSKFNRLELNTDYIAIDRGWWDRDFEEYEVYERRRLLIPELAYVHDNSVGRYFGPMNGRRMRLSVLWSPDLYPNQDEYSSKRGVEFTSVIGDYRRYYKAGYDYSFALRVSGGASYGKQPQRFFLGGVSNWINRPYYIDLKESDIEDIYIARFVTPLRGADLYERIGDRFFLTNMEFRFPFIQYLIFGWPVPYPFINVRGAMFSDFGAAWEGDDFKFTAKDQYNDRRLYSPVWGFGMGIRFPFPFIGWPTMWDVAWKSDLKAVSKPRFYLSLGYEF